MRQAACVSMTSSPIRAAISGCSSDGEGQRSVLAGAQQQDFGLQVGELPEIILGQRLERGVCPARKSCPGSTTMFCRYGLLLTATWSPP